MVLVGVESCKVQMCLYNTSETASYTLLVISPAVHRVPGSWLGGMWENTF